MSCALGVDGYCDGILKASETILTCYNDEDKVSLPRLIMYHLCHFTTLLPYLHHQYSQLSNKCHMFSCYVLAEETKPSEVILDVMSLPTG